jgi:hypothetical protein
MDELKAPQQNQILGKIAEILRMAEQNRSAEFLPNSLNVFGLFSDLLLPSSRTVEKMSYGDPLFRMPQQSRIPITADKEYLADVAGMVPFAAPAAKPSAQVVQKLAREIQTTPPVGAISPEIAARVIPKTKVVDEKGLPKLMYHATKEDFEEFKPGTANAIFATPDYDEFLNPYLGRHFNTKTGRFEFSYGANVRPVYIDAKNPFDYENPEHISKVVKWIKENNPDFQDIAASIGDKVKDGLYYQIERPIVQNAIRNLGFDGFYVKEGGEKNIAVFDSKNIKSALSDPIFEDIMSNPLMQDTTR